MIIRWPRRSNDVTIAFALIAFAEGSFPPADFEAALEASLVPGKTLLRYDRLWRMTRHTTKNGWIFGRIGFEYPNATIGLWDEQTKDYRSIQPGQLVRYAIDVQARRIGFELKSATVKPGTFQGNFQALLTRLGLPVARGPRGVSQPPWEEWRAHVRLAADRQRSEREGDHGLHGPFVRQDDVRPLRPHAP